MTVRYYSSIAGRMTLVGGITNTATSLVVDTTVGLPGAVPFTILIEPGTNQEEICDVTAVGGTTLTIVRGVDGSTAQAHNSGVEVRHGVTARDFTDSRTHENTTNGVHGVSGDVVGTTSSQTLTNKSLSGSTNTFTNIPKTALPNTVVYTTDTQTLTGKTISGSSNTISNVPRSALPSTVVFSDAGQTLNGANVFQSTATTQVPLITKGFSGQTGDLQRWTDSTGSVLGKVNSSGGFTVDSLTTTGTVAAASVTSSGDVTATGKASSVNLGSGAIVSQQLTATDMKNNFTYASGTTEYPIFYKRNGMVTCTGRIKQTAGFTGGTAFTAPNAYLPDTTFPFSLAIAMTVQNSGGSAGAPMLGFLDPATGNFNFTLLSGGASMTTGTWIAFSITYPAATP